MFQNQIANKMSGILLLDLVELEISRGKMVLPFGFSFSRSFLFGGSKFEVGSVAA
jgi:hypothetical protein